MHLSYVIKTLSTSAIVNQISAFIADIRLVGCFGFNGPLRQYFSLYRAASQRDGERRERIDESKNVQTTPTRTYCKRNIGPCPTVIKIVGRPGTGSLPSTIAPPDHPPDIRTSSEWVEPPYFLSILQRETSFVTSCLLFWMMKPFQNGVYYS